MRQVANKHTIILTLSTRSVTTESLNQENGSKLVRYHILFLIKPKEKRTFDKMHKYKLVNFSSIIRF